MYCLFDTNDRFYLRGTVQNIPGLDGKTRLKEFYAFGIILWKINKLQEESS